VVSLASAGAGVATATAAVGAATTLAEDVELPGGCPVRLEHAENINMHNPIEINNLSCFIFLFSFFIFIIPRIQDL
jgi:hypothetical protein